MNASVIIPTIGRPDNLKALLNSLARGTALPDEVLIIEQGDAEETRRLVERGPLPFSVSIVAQDEESSAVARNRGVWESTGDILFFFDDDTEVDAAYLKTAKEYLQTHPQTLGLTGSIADETTGGKLRRAIAILFNLYSRRARNVVTNARMLIVSLLVVK